MKKLIDSLLCVLMIILNGCSPSAPSDPDEGKTDYSEDWLFSYVMTVYEMAVALVLTFASFPEALLRTEGASRGKRTALRYGVIVQYLEFLFLFKGSRYG